jgi:D-tyrosyl-tRNA(Tyr) deacylase
LRALLQRVSQASVRVEREIVGDIGPGLVILLGLAQDDTEAEAHHIVNKTTNLRIFNDEDGKFNRSALDVGAELLIISQFTLYGDTRKGRRPSFLNAATPDKAKSLYLLTTELFRKTCLPVKTGTFQAHMMVSLTNDGPVTIMLDTSEH